MPLVTNGPTFTKLKGKLGNWAQPTDDCVTGTASELLAKETSDERRALLLYRENGSADRGWTGQAFYWPVLQTSPAPSVIFASKTLD